MLPARRLILFSAAILSVLAVIWPSGIASAPGRPAAETRVWAIVSAAQDHVGADRLVSAGERLGEPASCPFYAYGACVAPEAATAADAAGGARAGDSLAAAANCGGLSFSGTTPVLTASGKAVAISKLRKGDKVIATDVKTGKTGPAAVSAVWLNHDTNLFDLKIRSGGHTSVISTTWNHPFWDLTQHKWVKAGQLKHGDDLRAPSGAAVTALGGWTPRRHEAWMWDLTVPGPHDFYIQAAGTAVLVHNCPVSPLRLLHPRSSLSQSSLDFWGQQDTADIVASLRPGSAEPLLVKPNGLIMNGNTRITVLMERGFDVNALPRVPYVTEPPSDPFLGGG